MYFFLEFQSFYKFSKNNKNEEKPLTWSQIQRQQQFPVVRPKWYRMRVLPERLLVCHELHQSTGRQAVCEPWIRWCGCSCFWRCRWCSTQSATRAASSEQTTARWAGKDPTMPHRALSEACATARFQSLPWPGRCSSCDKSAFQTSGLIAEGTGRSGWGLSAEDVPQTLLDGVAIFGDDVAGQSRRQGLVGAAEACSTGSPRHRIRLPTSSALLAFPLAGIENELSRCFKIFILLIFVWHEIAIKLDYMKTKNEKKNYFLQPQAFRKFQNFPQAFKITHEASEGFRIFFRSSRSIKIFFQLFLEIKKILEASDFCKFSRTAFRLSRSFQNL